MSNNTHDQANEDILRMISERRLTEARTRLEGTPDAERGGSYYEALAALHIEELDYDQAAQAVERASALGRNTPKLRALDARCRNHMGLPMPRTSPDGESLDEAYFRAGLLYRDGRFAEAEESARKLLARSPGFRAAADLALASRSARGDASARSELSARWMADREYSSVVYLLADAERRGKADEVDLYVHDAIALPNADANLVSRLARLYLIDGRPQEALRIVDGVREGIRHHSRLESVRGQAYAALLDSDTALVHFENAFLAEPSGSTEGSQYVRALLSKGRLGQALGALRAHYSAVLRRR